MEGALKSLVLIRAKHLAESVTTPMFLADREGDLVFFNEAAEVMLGKSFNDIGRMTAAEWGKTLNVRSRDGQPFPLEAMPGWLEVQAHRPALGHVLLTTFNGGDIVIALCAVPLFTSQSQFEGAMVMFWEDDES